MSEKTGGPAFPANGSFVEFIKEGITLRDYFASKAMQGILSEKHSMDGVSGGLNVANVSRWAYKQADSMLAERAK